MNQMCFLQQEFLVIMIQEGESDRYGEESRAEALPVFRASPCLG